MRSAARNSTRNSARTGAARTRRSRASHFVAKIALLAAGLTACSEPPPSPLPESERDEAGVYAAVMRHVCRLSGDEYLPIVLADHSAWHEESPADGVEPRLSTVPDDEAQWILDALFVLRRDTLEDFARQPVIPRPLPEFPLDEHVQLLPRMSREEREAYFWQGFHDEFGEGATRVSVSHIGFDSSGTQAFLTVSFSKGFLYGWSNYVVVERKAAGWRVIASANFAQA